MKKFYAVRYFLLVMVVGGVGGKGWGQTSFTATIGSLNNATKAYVLSYSPTTPAYATSPATFGNSGLTSETAVSSAYANYSNWVSQSAYFYYSISASTGYNLTITGINSNLRSSNTGPKAIAVETATSLAGTWTQRALSSLSGTTAADVNASSLSIAIAAGQTLYIRYRNTSTTAADGTTVASPGTGRINSGSIIGTYVASGTPTITSSPTTLTGFTYSQGSGPSVAQSFTLSAANLTAGGGTVTITGSTDYEVSTTSATSGFGASATLTYTGTGSFSSNTTWVRLKAGLAAGSYNSETIGISGGGASSSVTASGTVTASGPSNDNCTGAIVMTPGTTCVTTNGTTVNASQQLAPTSCSGSTSSAANEVWYSFAADGVSSYTITGTTVGISDLVVGLYSGSCSSLTSVTCVDAVSGTGTENLAAGVLAAGTYFYRIYGWNGASGTFTTCVTYVPACVAPTSQPTSLNLTSVTSSTLSGSFTAASPAADGYIIVRSTSSTLSSNPVDGTSYSSGNSIGGGTVVQTPGIAITFTQSSLTPNTTYYYFVFSYNTTACTGGPKYLTSSPLTNNVTTCLATPTSSAATPVTPTGFTANWSAVSGASGYLLDVSTVNTFASFVSGYNAFPVSGGSTVSQPVSGLSSSTTYYYRVRATGTTCTSANSSTITVSTSAPACIAPAAQPTSLNFTAVTSTSLSGSFTAASPPANGYIIVQSTSSTLSSNPADGTSYASGASLGGGTVVQTPGTATSFTQTGLTSGTTYYYFVFSYNNTSCSGGPKYLTISPLTANSTTLGVIWSNTITGTNPNTSNPYVTNDVKDLNISVSGIGRGSGIAGTNANDRYNATSWNTTALDVNDYFYFTLTPSCGYKINFKNFVYTGQSSGTGPTNFALRSSVDGYASNIGSASETGATISLTGSSFQNASSPITFRMFAWGGSGGTYSINDFSFEGDVVSAPLTAVLSGTASICSGSTTNLQVAITGGTSPFTVVYNDGTSDFTVNNYTSGSNIPVSPTTTKTYHLVSVTSTGGCVGPNNGTPTVTVNPNVTAGIVSGTSPLCIGSIATYTSNGDAGGTWSSTNTAVATVNSSGVVTAVSAGTSNITYSISAGCGSPVSAFKTATVNPLPTTFNLTSTGSHCEGVGLTTGLNGSQTGVSYQLKLNGTNTGSPVTGTGNPISFGSKTAEGTYTAIATNTTTSCTQTMSGSETINPKPAATTITAGGPTTFCTGGSVVLTSDRNDDNVWYKDGSSIPGATGKTYTATASGTYTDVITNASGCSSTSNAITVTETSTNTWTGLTSNNWSVGSNWCSGIVPDGTTNAIIPSGSSRYPVLSVNSDVKALEIQTGAKITLNDKTFTINGDVSGTGVLTGSSTSNLVVGGIGGSGTINFDQTTDSITNVLNNFTLSRANGNIGIGSKLNLLSVLDVNGGGTLNPNGNLVLRSTSIAATARVAPVTGSIPGNVIVERFIPATARAYRFISPSVTTSTSIKANWMEGQNNPSTSVNLNNHPGYGTHITGYAGDAGGFDVTQNNAPSLFVFNNGSQAWANVPSTNVNLTAGFPHRLFVRGDRSISLSTNSPTPTPTILRATGVLKTGTVLYNTSSNPAIYNVTDSFSYMGNPYASPVDWNALTKNNLSTSYYTWDPHLSRRGGYAYYNTTDNVHNPASSSVNQYIQPGQAFFVQAKGTSPSLQFTESAKASTFTPVFRGASLIPALSIQLLFYDLATGRRITGDGVTATFDDGYSPYIAEEDSRKFYNLDENMAIVHADTTLSIEGRPFVRPTDTMHLRIWQYRQNDYFLKLDANNFTPGTTALVKDAYLNLETPVNIEDSTLVPFSITTDAASYAPDRFIVVFKPGSVLPVTLTDVKAYQKDKGIQVDWISRSETNITRYEVEKSLNGQQFEKAGVVEAKGNNAPVISYGWFDAAPAEGANYYRLKIVEKSGAVKYSQIVKVTIGKAGSSSIAVYPNPVKGNTISLHLTNMQKGKYTVNLYNNLGQKMMSKEITHQGSSANYSIQAGMLISKGIYRLNVSNGDVEMNTTVVFE